MWSVFIYLYFHMENLILYFLHRMLHHIQMFEGIFGLTRQSYPYCMLSLSFRTSNHALPCE